MNEIVLSPSQEGACKAFRKWLRKPDSMEFLLSGFAGSGKSFLVSYLIDFVRDEYRLLRVIDRSIKPTNFHFTATTNKAAKVLGEMMDVQTKTIHQALGLVVQNSYDSAEVTLVQKNSPISLNHSVLIVDEASMANLELLGWIRKTAKEHKDCKILYVGDAYQLPPVKENTCPIFNKTEDVFFLTDIQRQAAGSPIITYSHQYREMLDNPQQPWPVTPNNGDSLIHYTDKMEWRKALKGAFLNPHTMDDVRVLTWKNKRARAYNAWIRKAMGYTRPFEEGELLVCNDTVSIANRIRAKTDALFTVESSNPTVQYTIAGHWLHLRAHGGNQDFLKIFQPDDWDEATKLMNQIATTAKRAKAQRQWDKSREIWQKFWEIKNGWGDFRPIHAQTVHKAQGSTYKEVFIDVSDLGDNNKWYEVARLMYVAITRASTRVHLYGNLKDRYTRKDPMALMEAFHDSDNNSTAK